MARAATTLDVFNAVAEPRRREILDVLGDGRERAVSEVVEAAAVGLQTSFGAANSRSRQRDAKRTDAHVPAEWEQPEAGV